MKLSHVLTSNEFSTTSIDIVFEFELSSIRQEVELLTANKKSSEYTGFHFAVIVILFAEMYFLLSYRTDSEIICSRIE